MKRIGGFTICMLASLLGIAQEEETLADAPTNYEFISPARISRCKNLDGALAAPPVIIEVDRNTTCFLVERLDDGSALIQLWDNVTGGTAISQDESGRKYTYKVSPKDFEKKMKRRYSTLGIVQWIRGKGKPSGVSWIAGLTIIPVKYRPNIKIDGERTGFDFSKDVQLGFSVGLRQRISKFRPYYINYLFNVGLSSVLMDSINTRGTVLQSQDYASSTFAFGLVFDVRKFQFGLFTGIDKVAYRNLNNWIYQGKPWWSVGLGYSIFSNSTAEKTSGDDKK